MTSQRKIIFRTLLGISLITLLLLSLQIFVPRKYATAPVQPLPGIQYWNLPTGSGIAYTLIPAKAARKPYPIIFLQGGPGGFISQKTIDVLGQLANDGYDVYLYDQVGSGHSQRLDDITAYTAERHRRDLEAIIEKTRADKVILIGQSWGAILGTLLVASQPGKVHRFIVSGPGPIIPVRRELTSIPAPDSLHLHPPLFSNRQANEKTANMRSEAMRLYAQWFGTKLATDEEADNFQTLLNTELNKATVANAANASPAQGGGGYYVQQMTVRSFAKTPDPRPLLKNTPVPLLVLRGQYDNQPWGYVTEYLQLFPDHQLVVIPHAGHSIAAEHPDLYLQYIRRFLAQDSLP